jgi:TP901 family phage tail tape measure protein
MPASVRDILLVIKTKEDAQRTLGAISNAMRKASAQADIASSRARAAALRAQASQARINGATVAQVHALNQAAKAQDEHTRSIERAQKRVGTFHQSLERIGSLAQTTGLVMVGLGAATLYGLKQATDVAVAWDKQVRLTYTQVDKRLKPSLLELSSIGLRVAKDVAVPFEEIQTALFDVFSSTEATMPQAEKLLRSFSKAAVAGNTDITTASRATIGIMNAFKVPFKDVNKILDIQFQLVQEGVGTYEEWAQRIGLVTPSAVRAGQSIETMAAALATSTRMGISAARSATAVSRAFDAMSNPKVETKLKKIGVAVRDAKGNFRPLVDVITDWRKALEKLPTRDRIKSILDTLKGAGSTIEARRFLQGVLLTKGGLELFQDQIKEFATDKGAFQRAYDEMSKSVSAKTQLLNNAWMTLKLTLGNALLPTFSRFIDVLQRAVSWFNSLPKSTQETIARVALFAAGLLIVGGILTAIIGSLVAFAAAIAMAGTATLPVIGAILGVGAAIAIVVAAFTALIAGIVTAYQRSQNFRDMLAAIWAAFVALGGIVRDFATGLWSNFSTYILPALQNLWKVIEEDVIPAVRDFFTWWTANIAPMIKEAARQVNENLKPAFKAVADVLNQTVIPALKVLVQAWNENKDSILPVIKDIIGFSLAFITVAAKLVGIFIVALLKTGQVLFALGRTIGSVVTPILMAMSHPIDTIIGWLKRLWDWFGKLGEGAVRGTKAAMTALTNLRARITGLFSGAGTWLASAGRNLVLGFAGGIRSMASSAAKAAGAVAAQAITAVTSALAIHSPSKVFRDIGKDVIRGFILGVKDSTTLKQLQTAMFRVSRDVIRSINSADIKRAAKDKMRDKWNQKLSVTSRKLESLEKRRISTQAKLTAAQKKLNDQIKARADLATKIRDAIASSADITTLDEDKQTSVASIRKGLTERLAAVAQFQNNLRNLAARGMDKQTIADLASQGVERAGALVGTLVKGTDADIKEISALQASIRSFATQAGTDIAGDLYNAGIKAGQGLVKGLQSQMAAITKQMTAIANALVSAIKKELGIRSPSRVMQDIGVDTAQGYINGYMKNMNANMTDMTKATTFAPAAPRVRVGMNPSYGAGTNYTRIYDQNITVNTHEIDPRKTSVQLGWELEGRLA